MRRILIPMYRAFGLDNDTCWETFMCMAAFGIACSVKEKGDVREREKRFIRVINTTGSETAWERLIIRRVPGGYSVVQMFVHLYKDTVITDEEVAFFADWQNAPEEA